MSVIVDIACDLRSESNTLPIYAHSTSFDEPVTRLIDRKGLAKPLDLIAIPTLPQLIPKQVPQPRPPCLRSRTAASPALLTSRTSLQAPTSRLRRATRRRTANGAVGA